MKSVFASALCLMLSFNVFSQDQLQVDQVITLPEVGGNLSGITYNFDTDTYFMIQNNSGTIFEYDRSFSKPLRTIYFKDLLHDDTEDIVYLGNNKFAISEEQNTVMILTIEPQQVLIDGSLNNKAIERIKFPRPYKKNLGLEGVCLARSSERPLFYAVQEKRQKRIFRWELGSRDISEPFNSERILKHVMSDLSACTYDDINNHLLLLSHESSRIMKLDPQGNVIKTLDIPRVADQYEGLTLGPQNELILVSEPNIVVTIK